MTVPMRAMATVQPLLVGAEAVETDQRVDDAGDDNGVEAEEQAAERAGEGGLHQVQVGSHRSWSLNSESSYRFDPDAANPFRHVLNIRAVSGIPVVALPSLKGSEETPPPDS